MFLIHSLFLSFQESARPRRMGAFVCGRTNPSLRPCSEGFVFSIAELPHFFDLARGDGQNVLLLSGPGVATMIFSGVMTKAPFALAAPLKVSSAIFWNISTIGPSVTYSAVPLI